MEEKDIREFARKNYVPIVRPKTLEILIEEIKKNNPKTILEIGTAIGYSGIRMLENSVANLVTIEKDETMREVALKNFKKDIIEKCPDISVNMIEYHLKELQEQGFIKKNKGGRYATYIKVIK